MLGSYEGECVREIAKFSQADAEAYPDYGRTMLAYTRLLKPGGRVFLDACSARLKFPFSAFTNRS